MRNDDKYSRKIFIPCDCGAHAIELIKFYDEDIVTKNNKGF